MRLLIEANALLALAQNVLNLASYIAFSLVSLHRILSLCPRWLSAIKA